jgi:hypothetical protein
MSRRGRRVNEKIGISVTKIGKKISFAYLKKG